jgi:hypothetical protein
MKDTFWTRLRYALTAFRLILREQPVVANATVRGHISLKPDQRGAWLVINNKFEGAVINTNQTLRV